MAHSLLGVVNELHNMELSFLKILTEAAMKLAALTDASLLVLFETPEGRRFAGRRHLCDAYLEGRLAASERDVELEVEVGISGVKERTAFAEAEETDESFPVRISRDRKRFSDAADAPLVPWKRAKTARRPLDVVDLVEAPGDVGGANGGVDIPAIKIDTDADGVVDDVSFSTPNRAPIERLDAVVSNWRFSPRSSSGDAILPHPGVAPPNSNFALKIEALKRIPGHRFERTNSDEFRFLNSCMYEFGRILSQKYLDRLQETPDLPHRAYFLQEYEEWVLQFENIHPYGHLMIKKENRESKRTLLAYMRKTAGDSFGICIKKRLNKRHRDLFGGAGGEAFLR